MMLNKSWIQNLENKLSDQIYLLPNSHVIFRKHFLNEIEEFYLSRLKAGQTVLDFNPGFEGIYSKIDHSKIKYIALEQNQLIRDHLREQNMAALNWQVPQIPLKDKSVDFIFVAAFFEHMPNYLDGLNLLLEMKRVLNENGLILMFVPNYLSQRASFFDDYKHGLIITKRRMLEMIMDCGFKSCKMKYTLGWITMRQNIFISFFRICLNFIIIILSSYIVDRLVEIFGLENFIFRFKKTFFELIAIEISAE